MESICKVGIVGYGKFGHFLHQLIRRFTLDVDVVAYDPAHAIDDRIFVSLEKIGQCDVIIIAVPIPEFERALLALLPHAKTDAIIVDIATVKTHTVNLLRTHAHDRRYIAAHPMFGPQSYRQKDGDINGFRIVYTDKNGVDDKNFWTFKLALNDLGFDTLGMSAESHDRHLAETLFLTHYVGQIVSRGDFSRSEIDTVSFGHLMDTVESVAHDTQLFRDVSRFIPEECKETIRRFESAVREVHELLEMEHV